jgi:D-alanine-D-alanine ligase
MKRLRTLVVMHSTLVPPDSLDGHSAKDIEEWRTEYDVVSTLKKSGHEVRCLGISDSLEELRAVTREWKPEIVFNLLEEFDGIVTYDQHVVAFLELLRQPYTGCNPRGLLLARDKPLSKQLLSFHHIPSPQFAVFRRGLKLRLPRKIKYPLFVKSTTEDASLGISQASIVTDKAQLKQRVQFVHDQVQTDALVEEYIEGRELYVGVMGNDRLTRLPVWEMRFGSVAESGAGIATRRVKWDKKYQKAKDLAPAVVARLDKLSRRVYRCLGLSGCARIDYRMNAEGQIYVIEANPNPNLAEEEDFAQSAKAAGTSYPELLEKLLALGAAYQAEWRAYYG